jgi:hypothetical protein
VEGKRSIWPVKISGKGVRSFNKDLLVFAFFLFLSFIFWYLNSLRKDIEVDLRYPVKYINTPRDRTVIGEMPEKLTLNLIGPGYSIVKLKISGNRAPLVIDFSKVTWKRVPENRNPDYFIVSNGLIANFSRQLRSEFQIVSVKPDTLFFSLQKKVSSIQGSKPGGGKNER